MKKIYRITESDINRIVKKILSENKPKIPEKKYIDYIKRIIKLEGPHEIVLGGPFNDMVVGKNLYKTNEDSKKPVKDFYLYPNTGEIVISKDFYDSVERKVPDMGTESSRDLYIASALLSYIFKNVKNGPIKEKPGVQYSYTIQDFDVFGPE